MSAISFGSFELTSVAQLPNCSVAFPGEHWSDGKASETITPGSLVVPTSSAGARVWELASAGALDPRAAVALQCVKVPDVNPGSEYSPQLTPNQIVNLPILTGDYVHAYRSGAFNLTLAQPDDTYSPGDTLVWNPGGTAMGQTVATGAWEKGSAANAFFEVVEFDALDSDPTQGVLTVHSLRSQF